MPSTKKNALALLGRALNSYLKTVSTNKGNKQKPPVLHSKHRPARRHHEYSEQQGIQSTNRVRSCIVQPDKTTVTVEVFNHNSAHIKRRYRRR